MEKAVEYQIEIHNMPFVDFDKAFHTIFCRTFIFVELFGKQKYACKNLQKTYGGSKVYLILDQKGEVIERE